MSSLSPKDRVSLCSFTFSDGRRCRAPRVRNNPRFCFYHAQKDARARAAKKLGKDLAYFFSGDYLSACDLSTALARLIPAVLRGDVKPKTAHTVAYLVQTLMQAIHLSKHEYINAFGTDGWRKSIRNSVNSNQDYRFPPDPEPEQPALSALRTNLPSESPQPPPAAVAAVAHPFRGEASRPASPPQPQSAAGSLMWLSWLLPARMTWTWVCRRCDQAQTTISSTLFWKVSSWRALIQSAESSGDNLPVSSCSAPSS